MTLFRFCLLSVIIRSVLFGLSFSLLDYKTRYQSKQIIVHLIVKVICKHVCHQHAGDV